MGEEIIDKADKYIQEIADKLGVAAEHVYGMLIQQQVADGITTLSLVLYHYYSY